MTAISKPEMETFLKGLVGPWGEPERMTIEYSAARRMALAVENFDPIHYDEAAAHERGYRGLVAPWPLLWLVFFNCSEFEIDFPFGKATIHGEDKYEFQEPLIVGDEITVHASISSATLKEGKAGPMGMIVEERKFMNQRGEVCAVLATTAIRR